MCMACEEMNLYYAYLDAIEEAKRKAQPWECEVTILPQDGEVSAPAHNPAPVKSASAKPLVAKSGFACDEPE